MLDTHKYNRVKYELSKERVNSSGDPNMVQFLLTILNISEEDYGNMHSPCCILIVISNHDITLMHFAFPCFYKSLLVE